MVTIEELRKENRRLREMQVKIKVMQKDNDDRKKLLMDNKRLARRIKFDKSIGRFGKSVDTAKKAAKITKAVGKTSGKVLAKTGRGALRGLQRYARFLNEQEKKQRSLNKKLKSVRRKKRRK